MKWIPTNWHEVLMPEMPIMETALRAAVLYFFIVFILRKLTYHSTFFQNIFEHRPMPIIKDGKLLRRNMRKELLTEDELIANLRQNGMDDVSEVRKACVESDGNISFIKYDENADNPKKKERIE